jgi:MFS family permease
MHEGRDETELERWDRNYTELLQELRVAQTGVQILFAFLLTLPFQARFGKADTLDHIVYGLTLVAAAIATAALIAPVSFHRLMFRHGRKRELVLIASRLAQIGLASLAVAIVGAVFMVMNVVGGLGWAAGLAIAAVALYVALWYVLPELMRRRGMPSDELDEPGE